MQEQAFELTENQPRPGEGVLCEHCLYRRTQMGREPCKLIVRLGRPPVLERFSLGGTNVTVRDTYGEDFFEACNLFESREEN